MPSPGAELRIRIRQLTAASTLLVLLCTAEMGAQEVSGRRTAVLGAMDIEVEGLRAHLVDPQTRSIQGIEFTEGLLDGHPVVVAQTGVGKVNAAIVATLLIEHFRPARVIFTGIAGSLNPDLSLGDVVLASKLVQHDLGLLSEAGIAHWGTRALGDTTRNPVYFPADTAMLWRAQRAATDMAWSRLTGMSRVPKVLIGTVATGDVFVASAAKRQEIRDQLGADAVDMEGAAVAQVCWQLGRVPLLVIRSISDAANELPHETYVRFRELAARNSAEFVRALVAVEKLEPRLN